MNDTTLYSHSAQLRDYAVLLQVYGERMIRLGDMQQFQGSHVNRGPLPTSSSVEMSALFNPAGPVQAVEDEGSAVRAESMPDETLHFHVSRHMPFI